MNHARVGQRAHGFRRRRGAIVKGEPVKITVDADRCVGSAYCQRIAPALFDLGDDGFAFVTEPDVTGAGAAAAREAEAACPSMAILVQEA